MIILIIIMIIIITKVIIIIIIIITSCNPCTRAYTTHLSFMREQPTLAAKERSLYDLSNIMSRFLDPQLQF